MALKIDPTFKILLSIYSRISYQSISAMATNFRILVMILSILVLEVIIRSFNRINIKYRKIDTLKFK